ncbi:hypothetical protein RND71_042087 [Anisodus tanguticus]|uniref:Uncharacterized protein n=1 Tax=Anisodus tanguticus TaxID=243964 RepID=A0AAE1UUA5_9SOLA|nr:hypothetical protein RND71_042087 [Anisodus tanguticus]
MTEDPEALSKYFSWYRPHLCTFIGNPSHNVARGYQHLAGRQAEALALGHQESYMLAYNTSQDSIVSDVQKVLTEKFRRINIESMNAASLGMMLSFTPHYTPSREYEEPPTVHFPHRHKPTVPTSGACGRGRQGRAGNKRG